MADVTTSPGPLAALARIDLKLLRTAAVGGLLGGMVLFLLMASYNASTGMGFLTILNVCFAAWVFRGAGMTAAMPAERMAKSALPGHTKMASPMPTHSAMASAMPSKTAMAGHAAMGHHATGTTAMMNEPLVASHAIVGGLLHLAMSAGTGAAFAVALAVLIRSGLRVLATPAGYVTAAAAGGALLYVIMIYAVAPAWNSEIVDFTPRVPFFISHLLYGGVVGAWVYWQRGYERSGAALSARRPSAA